MQEQGERITLEDVRRVLQEGREFYKGGPKSSNKMYESALDEHQEIALNKKEETRNLNAALAANEKYDLDAATKDMSPVQKGEHIVTNNIRSGNCEEMTRATLHLCMADESIRSKMTGAWVANTAPHTFLLVSDGPALGAQGSLKSLADLAHGAHEGVWVIDTWMNIACKGADYCDRIEQKIDKWAQQGKVVVYEREVMPVKTASGEMKDVPMPEEDGYDTARNFAKKLLGAEVTLIEIALPPLENTQDPKHRESDGPPPVKRRRIQAAAEGSSSHEEHVHAPQPRKRATSQALTEQASSPRSPGSTQSPSDTPKSSTLKRGFHP